MQVLSGWADFCTRKRYSDAEETAHRHAEVEIQRYTA